MDHWPESPLNKAHFYHRRANVLVKKLCFDEAIECHLSAAKFLAESFNATDNDKARESIHLQKEYHLKQKDFLLLKKLQYQACKEVVRVHKEAMSGMMKAKDVNGMYSGPENERLSLQKVIYRTIEEADSLLDFLINKDESINSGSSNKPVKDLGESKISSKNVIHPKDDKTVMEELRIVNYQLRTLIVELMAQLTASEKEVVTLKARVAELEAGNRWLEPNLGVASEFSSPFVLSPEDELPQSKTTAEQLPALAPLEMPNFDLSVLHKYQSTNH